MCQTVWHACHYVVRLLCHLQAISHLLLITFPPVPWRKVYTFNSRKEIVFLISWQRRPPPPPPPPPPFFCLFSPLGRRTGGKGGRREWKYVIHTQIFPFCSVIKKSQHIIKPLNLNICSSPLPFKNTLL